MRVPACTLCGSLDGLRLFMRQGSLSVFVCNGECKPYEANPWNLSEPSLDFPYAGLVR